MNRYNFKIVEENGRLIGTKIKLIKQKQIKLKKNFTVWKCFHILQVKFIWGM